MGGFVNFTTRIAPESIVAGSVVDYSLATAYTTGQIVNYNGALWTATANSTGQAPAAGSAYWEITNASQQAPKGGAILNGTTQYYSHPDNANLNFGTGDFSISRYVNPSVTTGFPYLARKFQDASNYYAIFLSTNNSVGFEAKIAGVTVGAYTSAQNVISEDSAYLITFVSDRDGDAGKFYINGVEVSTTINTALSSSTDLSFTGNLNLGFDGASNYANWKDYGASFYNYALTQSEVTARWNNGQPQDFVEPYATRDASQTDLLSGWDFTSGWYAAASTINDLNSFTTAAAGGVLKENLLVIGKKYQLVIDGATTSSNINIYFSDSPSLATSIGSGFGTFTFTALDSSIYIRNDDAGTTDITTLQIITAGETFSALPQDAGTNGWKVKVGGVTSIMNSTASPIATSKGAYEVYTDARATIATATPTTMTIPKGYVIKEIRALGSASLTAIKIGTSSGGEQIVQSTTTTGTTPKILTLASTAKATYSESADTTIYVQHTTAGQTMNVILIFEKVGA